MQKFLNKITCGDCYELIKELPDKSVDCIYTDIPYKYEAGGGGTSRIAQQVQKMKNELQDNGIWDGIDYSIFQEFVRVMKNINIFIWCSKVQIFDILKWFNENTDSTYQILTWNKTNPVPMCNGNWLSDIEYKNGLQVPNENQRKAIINTNKLKQKKVCQIKDGKIINTFSGISEASRQTKISISCISRCCNLKRKSTNGYEWRFI